MKYTILNPVETQPGVMEYDVAPADKPSAAVTVQYFPHAGRGYCGSCSTNTGRASATCAHVAALKRHLKPAHS